MPDGDLSTVDDLEARYGGKDATGELVIALNRTLGRLQEIIHRVIEMSAQVTETLQAAQSIKDVANELQTAAQVFHWTGDEKQGVAENMQRQRDAQKSMPALPLRRAA
jgi:methyl-accepting chemotaxis protein